MSLSHRVGQRAGDDQVPPEMRLDSPSAARRRTRRWADPRLWVGVGFVLVSVVVGATVIDSGNSTEAVWRLRHGVSAGSPLSAADLEQTMVHFADDTGRQYVSAALPLARNTRVVQDVGAGELLPTSATTTASVAAPEQMPLGVPGSGVPADLAPGDHVDVWAVSSSDRLRPPAPVLVLSDVTVTGVSAAGPGGLDADRQILVALPVDTDIGGALAALNGASTVLIQNGS